MTSFPRDWGLLVSDCQTPAVAVFMPVPSPTMTLPTSICGTPYAEACSIAPMVITPLPTRTVLGRPRMSPVQMVEPAPKKHPSVYIDAIVPCMDVEGFPIVLRKSWLTRTFPKTPCSRGQHVMDVSDGKIFRLNSLGRSHRRPELLMLPPRSISSGPFQYA